MQTTNPSRQSPADGLGYATTYAYDLLGRQISVTTPDGAVAPTSYSGNQTTVTDAAGHARKTTVDGLGRLMAVAEDPATSNYQTSYVLDPLNNVRTVTQGAQTRTFVYDTLNRQTSATNPESGTVSYTYDSVGNVLSRTDARGIVTSTSYDALNRPLSVSYTDGITPPVTYGYDAVANGIGQLTSIANGNSTTSFTAFDAMQSVTASSQVTVGQTYTFGYGYNLAEALTSETYPSGRVVTTAYDGANRPVTVSGSWNGVGTSYVTQTAYWPHGGIYYFTRGNGVWHAEGYNSRLQVAETYEAVNNVNSVNTMLFISCPQWGGNTDFRQPWSIVRAGSGYDE